MICIRGRNFPMCRRYDRSAHERNLRNGVSLHKTCDKMCQHPGRVLKFARLTHFTAIIACFNNSDSMGMFGVYAITGNDCHGFTQFLGTRRNYLCTRRVIVVCCRQKFSRDSWNPYPLRFNLTVVWQALSLVPWPLAKQTFRAEKLGLTLKKSYFGVYGIETYEPFY